MKRYVILLYPQLLGLLGATIYYFTEHWIWLTLAPIVVLLIDGINSFSYQWMRPIKSRWWDWVRKEELERMITKSAPAIVKYPMLVWLEFDAKEDYLTLRQKQFAKIAANKMQEVTAGILQSFTNSSTYYSNNDLDYDENKVIDDFLAKEKKGK